MSDNNNRRRHMEILKGIPPEVLTEPSMEETEAMIYEVQNMDEFEAKSEVIDLRKEKSYLIAAIEHLKERLTKKP